MLLGAKERYKNEELELVGYTEGVLLLYAAGETLEGTEEEEIPEKLKFDLQLKHICREAIRKHLLKLDPHQHLFSRIPHLGLPESLNKYLLFYVSLETDFDNDDDDDDDDMGRDSEDEEEEEGDPSVWYL